MLHSARQEVKSISSDLLQGDTGVMLVFYAVAADLRYKR